MAWRSFGLSLLLIGFAVARAAVISVQQRSIHTALEIRDIDPPQDLESVLAMGERIPLACADVASLEMIRGVSDRIAFALVERKQQLLKMRARGSSEVEALQSIYGIGLQNATTLMRYITLDGECLIEEIK